MCFDGHLTPKQKCLLCPPPPVRMRSMQSIALGVSVCLCLCVCSLTFLNNRMSELHFYMLTVTWSSSDAVQYVSTSRFVDDVMFSHNQGYMAREGGRKRNDQARRAGHVAGCGHGWDRVAVAPGAKLLSMSTSALFQYMGLNCS